jgi:hypothetical protein
MGCRFQVVRGDSDVTAEQRHKGSEGELHGGI